jgi:type II secretory pathway component PulK
MLGNNSRLFGKREGSILVLTLWVLALLAIMVYGLHRRVSLGIREERWNRVESEANYLLLTLGRYAVLRFAQDGDPDVDSYQEAWGNAYDVEGLQLFEQFAGVDATKAGFRLTLNAIDEQGKINVNLASEELLLEIVREVGVESNRQDLVSAIVDWKDSDSTGPNETEYYSTLDPPYEPANRDLRFLEELLFVRGIDERLFFGEDANNNGILDSNEDDGLVSWPGDNGDGLLQIGLRDLLTVYGDGTLNVNGSSEPVIRAVFRAAIGNDQQAADLARAVINRRRGGDGRDGTEDDRPFNSFEELVEFIASKLGETDTRWAAQIARPFDVVTSAVRFLLSVENPNQHMRRRAEFVVYREEGEAQIVEWRDL